MPDLLTGNLYRIYVEDVQRPIIANILKKYVSGYTMTPSEGMYEGVTEKSLVIDILPDGTIGVPEVKKICQELSDSLHQETVAFAAIPCYSDFVHGTQYCTIGAK